VLRIVVQFAFISFLLGFMIILMLLLYVFVFFVMMICVLWMWFLVNV
jgi:hypothetical protein